MAEEWLAGLLRRFARPTPVPGQPTDLRAIDDRLGVIERNLDEIEARLRLLEIQADPRGWGGDHV